MAVKLARSKEGQIREDVETELRLLYALSAQSTAGVGVSGGRKSSNASSAAGTGDEKGAGEMDGGEVFFDAAGAAAADDDELLALARGGRKNVIKLLGAGTYHDLRRYLVLEYCASTLEALLEVAEKPPSLSRQKDGPFGWLKELPWGQPQRPQLGLTQALKIGFEISLAVAFLHNCAISGCVVLHRDIKPSNVGLTSSGSVRLLDLGLARVVPLHVKEGISSVLQRRSRATVTGWRPSEVGMVVRSEGEVEGGGDGVDGGVDSGASTAAAAGSNSDDGRARGSRASPMSKSPSSRTVTSNASSTGSNSEFWDFEEEERLLPPYKMTGYTGSLRYMAPEVATDQPYDESVDVYSLSHVLWEVASLERWVSWCCA